MNKSLALALTLIAACGQEADLPAAPIGSPTPHTLPVAESTGAYTEGGTTEDALCPWDGRCSALVSIDACSDWALPCGDGYRCVDTEMEHGIVCEAADSSSSSSSSGDATDSSSDESGPSSFGGAAQ